MIALGLFASAAALAWITAPVADHAVLPETPTARRHKGIGSARSSASVAAATPDTIVAKLERELLFGEEPVAEHYSAAEADRLTANGCFAVEYASEWARHDPSEMLAWIERRGRIGSAPFNSDLSWLYADIVFKAWAEKDLEAALSAAARVSRSPIHAQALATVLQFLWRSDPDRARAVIAEQAELFSQSTEVSLNYDDNHGPADFAFLASLPPGQPRGLLLSLVLKDAAGSYTVEYRTKAMAFWQQAPDDVRRDLIAAGFGRRSEVYLHSDDHSPENVLPTFPGEETLLREYAEKSGDESAAGDFLKSYGDAWAARDPAEAIAWAQANLKGEDRLKTSIHLFSAAAAGNLDSAIAAWQSLPAGTLRAQAAGALLLKAPDERKPGIEALIATLSPRDQETARAAATPSQ